MPARRAATLLATLAAVLLAAPAGAGAATLAPLKRCYVTVAPEAAQREAVDVAGTGFTPNAVVDVAVDGRVERTVQADPAGALPAVILQAPYQRRGQRPFSVTATERGNPANSASATSLVTALALQLRPRRARPDRRIRFRGRGFTGPGRVWAHYLYGGKVRKTVRLARRPGVCGTFSVRRRQIPVRRVRTGSWTLQVDQRRAYDPSPASVWVRLTIRVQRVFRMGG